MCTPVIADVPAALTDDLLTSDSVAEMDVDNSASTRLDSEFFTKVTPQTPILQELIFFLNERILLTSVYLLLMSITDLYINMWSFVNYRHQCYSVCQYLDITSNE